MPSDSPRELTLRAALTGAVLGALLVPCNVYTGLKIGWSFNMSITAALLSYGFWGLTRRGFGPQRVPAWGLLENNVNQTCASSAASIISAGLVAPIPALAILTGKTLSWPVLVVWLSTVSILGVLAGLTFRRQMIEVQKLPFPSGIATAEAVREIYARGDEARHRIRYLLTAGSVSAAVKLIVEILSRTLAGGLPKLGPAIGLGAIGLPSVSTRSLGFLFDPSFLMIGFGAIVGLRIGASLLLGSLLAWGVVTPWLFASGTMPAPAAGEPSYGLAIEFLLWPGVAAMVCAALVSFSLSLPSVISGLIDKSAADDEGSQHDPAPAQENRAAGENGLVLSQRRNNISGRSLWVGWLLAAAAAVTVQAMVFGITPLMGVTAVLVTFVLAIVAARVSGETGIPPIGALGKVTQLTFGALHPTNVTENLMTANVTGGAAGQCSDLLHDLKAGRLLGASIRAQAAAQFLGVLVGSVAGSAAYLILIPDPAAMLLTEQWPAPAVATWKAVAELFRDGMDAAPPGAFTACLIGGVLGAGLAILERKLSSRGRHWCPSPVALGLAFVIPAFNSISLFIGAVAAALAARVAPSWSKRFTLPIAAGLVAGESLAGVLTALVTLVTGG